MNVEHVIIDRDGVLNVERPNRYVVTPDELEWEDSALGALRRLSGLGLRISIATNQSCIGRGLVTRAQIDSVHQRLVNEARAAGARVDAIFVCEHAPWDQCECRKPKPGLLVDAISASRAPHASTVFVGDSTSDVLAARAAGIGALLVRTGKGRESERTLGAQCPPVFDDVGQAAGFIATGLRDGRRDARDEV